MLIVTTVRSIEFRSLDWIIHHQERGNLKITVERFYELFRKYQAYAYHCDDEQTVAATERSRPGTHGLNRKDADLFECLDLGFRHTHRFIVGIQSGAGQPVAKAMDRPGGLVQRNQVPSWRVEVPQEACSKCSGSSIRQTDWRAVT